MEHKGDVAYSELDRSMSGEAPGELWLDKDMVVLFSALGVFSKYRLARGVGRTGARTS